MPKWTKLQLETAVRKVKQREMSLNKAAKVYNIPATTLHKHVHETTTKLELEDHATILTYEEEKEIFYICQVASKILSS